MDSFKKQHDDQNKLCLIPLIHLICLLSINNMHFEPNLCIVLNNGSFFVPQFPSS